MKPENYKICYFGTYRANYSRNRILITGLKTIGFELVECHEKLWNGIADRVQVANGGWITIAFIRRFFGVYWRLLMRYVAMQHDYDVMIVGYPGQVDVFFARLLTWLHRKPLVLDMFMSIYLVALEREIDHKSRLSIWLLRLIEKLACHCPDMIICDTDAYVKWYCDTYGLDQKKFRLVPTGADDSVFKSGQTQRRSKSNFHVLYYGSYIPNHGVDIIIEAANLLREQADVQFELVGDGPTRVSAQNLAQHYNLKNLCFSEWMPQEVLSEKVLDTDLLLGVFGTTPQSLMTIQNKIYEGLAMSKPIVTGDSTTISAQFSHRTHLYLIKRADPQALVKAILTLKSNPSLSCCLAKQGNALFREKYSVSGIGQFLKGHLEQLL